MFHNILQKIKNKVNNIYYNGFSDLTIPINSYHVDELDMAGDFDPFREVVVNQDVITTNEPRRWQNGSSSCVAQTFASFFFDLLGIVASATPLYQKRSNRPYGGMSYTDVIKHFRDGLYLEKDVPSQYMNDSQMDNAGIPALSNVTVPEYEPFIVKKDFYEVAKAVRNNKVASIWFSCTVPDWERYIIDDIVSTGVVRHSVKVFDAVRVNGVEYLVIFDSSGYYRYEPTRPVFIGKDGIRLISKKAFDKMVFHQYTVVEIKKDNIAPKPQFTFPSVITFGMMNDDVRRLQTVLVYENLLDIRAVTGYYGNLTRTAVKQWQIKHNVADMQELNIVNGLRVGAKTLKKLNELYN